MTESFQLGRIGGIRVAARWSVLAVLTLIAVGLAAGRLPLVAPGRSGIGIVSPSDVARTVQNAELRSRADAISH